MEFSSMEPVWFLGEGRPLQTNFHREGKASFFLLRIFITNVRILVRSQFGSGFTRSWQNDTTPVQKHATLVVPFSMEAES